MKKIKNERVWVTYRNSKQQDMFCITSKTDDTSWYYLYDITGDKPVKVGKAKTPDELEKKFDVMGKIK